MSADEVTAKQLDASTSVGQPVQPASAPGHVVAGYKLLRSQLLVWCGILGGVLTVFSNIGKVLTLSNWAHWIVTRWQDWTHAFWSWLFSLFDISVPTNVSPPLSFLVFLLMLSIGIWLRTLTSRTEQSAYEHDFRWPAVVIIVGASVLSSVAIFYFYVDVRAVIAKSMGGVPTVAMSTFIFVAPSVVLATILSKHKSKSASSSILLYFFLIFVVFFQWGERFTKEASEIVYAVSILAIPPILIAAVVSTPISPLTKQLSFIAIGLIVLIGLNEISRHDLSFLLQAPK